jgi:hypothetical protein
MGNVFDNSCTENQITRFMFNKLFSENRTVYEITSKNAVETEGSQMTPTRPAIQMHALTPTYAHTDK